MGVDCDHSNTILCQLANFLGAPEPALRLLVSILLGYPLALLHRYTLYGQFPVLQHVYFAATGLTIGYFNYGWEVLHSVTTVLIVFGILRILGGKLVSVISVFIFTMTYLLVGYYMTGTETYDIKWSMPQCVLTLRLIGLAFDLLDGYKDEAELSAEQKKTALRKQPTLLEVAAHTYFPASFLVGPQFPLKRYLDFVKGDLRDEASKQDLPLCVIPGLKRGCLGFLYLGLYQVGTYFFQDVYVHSTSFQVYKIYPKNIKLRVRKVYHELSAFMRGLLLVLPLWQKYLMMGIWGKIMLYKYISCWLISEGVCIISGLTYNGKGPDGKLLWDGCANVKLRVFEGATKFGHYIASFNINTNHWVAQYVYKRLKFLNNRAISQAAALTFLAVWHGLHSGYYMCFLLEFVVIKFEKDFESMISKTSNLRDFLYENKAFGFVTWLVLKLYTVVFMGYCLVPFVLLSFTRWFEVYKSLYFIGHGIFFLWPLYAPLVKSMLKLCDSRLGRLHED